MNTIEKRIEALERANRRYRYLFTLVGLASLAAVCVGAGQAAKVPDIIRAKQFRVVNSDGRLLVALAATTDGKAGAVGIYTTKGRQQVLLAGSARGNGVVTTFDDKGEELVELNATELGGGAVITYNDKGQTIAEIGQAVRTGEGIVSTHDGTGRRVWQSPSR